MTDRAIYSGSLMDELARRDVEVDQLPVFKVGSKVTFPMTIRYGWVPVKTRWPAVVVALHDRGRTAVITYEVPGYTKQELIHAIRTHELLPA